MLLKDKQRINKSGVLMAISSLPSKYGIGSMGIEAYKFIDFLKASNQSLWQILPLNPIGEGNSPYKSISCFAGEILYIDIDFLVRDGLLIKNETAPKGKQSKTDYSLARQSKLPLLRAAAENFNLRNREYIKFAKENAFWLNDYALFCVICDLYKTENPAKFPEKLKYRIPTELIKFKKEHEKLINFYKITQFFFFKQYYALKAYANQSGIQIIGDIPFYISPHSADVWKNPSDFKLNRSLEPVEIAGVPPDIFSATGQLWGNPIYDWQHQRIGGFLWWKKRLLHYNNMFDIIRIDHFRAFADFYVIPANAKNATEGKWRRGVGIGFWDKIYSSIGEMDIIAEDLGGEDDPLVIDLLHKTGFPNMKVLQFGFTGEPDNPFLAQNFSRNCVCYTGTHDNNTTLGWYSSLDLKTKIICDTELSQFGELPIAHKMIRAAVLSPAKYAIFPMQDILSLDEKARMNTPGTTSHNWVWRLDSGIDYKETSSVLCKLTKERN